MHSSSRFVAALATAASISVSANAFADEPATEKATAPSTDAQPSNDPPEEWKHWSIELNPLAATIGRYSLQAEFLPAPHHAIVLNPHFDHVSATATVGGKEYDAGSFTGGGAEIGYRFYTARSGPAGFFIGPSILLSGFSSSTTSVNSKGATVTSDISFMSYGAALDIGGQAVIGPGIVVSGGFGLQYTKTSQDLLTDNLNLAAAILAGSGVRPRFLLSVGYAF